MKKFVYMSLVFLFSMFLYSCNKENIKITKVEINYDNELIFSFSDEAKLNLGLVTEYGEVIIPDDSRLRDKVEYKIVELYIDSNDDLIIVLEHLLDKNKVLEFNLDFIYIEPGIEYSLKLHFNFGKEVDYPSTLTEYDEYTITRETTRFGYNLVGWFRSSDFSGEEVIKIEKGNTEDVELYAKWEIAEYNLTLHFNGGLEVEYSKKFVSLMDVELPLEIIKAGNRFLGWYDNPEFTGSAYLKIARGTAEDIELYAKWEAVDFEEALDFLDTLIPEELEYDLDFASSYLGYDFSWLSSNASILSNTGKFKRPYTEEALSLTVEITDLNNVVTTKVYNWTVSGYKVLENTKIMSSYIYTNYPSVNEDFFLKLDIINTAFILADQYGNLTGPNYISNVRNFIMPEANKHGNWVIMSVGPSSSWSALANNPVLLDTFTTNIVNTINLYGFDGVDIDWETPSLAEATLYTELMKQVYTKVKANNPHHLVTTAIAGGMWQMDKFDLLESAQYIDYINVMTYGLVSNGGRYQNPLYSRVGNHNPTHGVGSVLDTTSIEDSVKRFRDNYGIPYNKLIIGLAFYGIQQVKEGSEWNKGSSPAYHTLVNNYFNNPDYTVYYDEVAKVPYILKNDGTEFISFDNPQSILDKAAFIKSEELAGFMYWQNGQDNTGTLLEAMWEGLRE